MSDNSSKTYGAGYNRYRSALTANSSVGNNSLSDPFVDDIAPNGSGTPEHASRSGRPTKKSAGESLTTPVKQEARTPERSSSRKSPSLFVSEDDEEEEPWLYGEDDEVSEVRLRSSPPIRAAQRPRGHNGDTDINTSSPAVSLANKINTSRLLASDNNSVGTGNNSSPFKIPAIPTRKQPASNGPILAYSTMLQASPASAANKKAEDPEVTLIKTMRNKYSKSWAEVVTSLNLARVKRSEEPNWTTSSAYSAYILATPLTATPAAEIGFTPKDYMHLRYPNEAGDPASVIHSSSANPIGLTGGVSRAAKKRVKDWNNIKELETNVRKTVSKEEEKEELKKQEMQVLLRDAKQRVQRNFWVLVADEMERKGARLYSAEGLAKKWKEMDEEE